MVIWEKYQDLAEEWDGHVAALSGDFYQTYGWGEVRRLAGWNPVRMLAKRGEQVIGVASILVKRKFGFAVCWIPGGPAGAIEVLDKEFLIILARELQTRLIYCRISILRAHREDEPRLLMKNGWQPSSVRISSKLTMLYSLAGNETERLARASGNWRHNLKRAGRHELCVELWKNPNHHAISELYREMEGIKSLPVQHSLEQLEAILRYCKDNVIVFRCLGPDGKLLAIRAAGLCGETAVDLLAAAGSEARKVYATHATLWALLSYCNQIGVQKYDLSGVDPEGNKGVYDFKHGTGATLVQYLGEWEWASMPGLRRAVNWGIARSLNIN